MKYPYVCLHCNKVTKTNEPGALIQCECGEAAWKIRCICQGQATTEGDCVDCGRRC
jgi:hypothetical protein